MKLPAEWRDLAANMSVMHGPLAISVVERCYTLANKPPKELTDSDWKNIWWHAPDDPVSCCKFIVAEWQDKQREPERVKFRAARDRGNSSHIEMIKVGPSDPVSWEWLEPEQSFEVVLP